MSEGVATAHLQKIPHEMSIVPAARDRVALSLVVIAAIALPPFVDDYWMRGLMIPMLIYGIAALGLNIVTGYAGLISLGQAAFMAVGAFTAVICYGRYGVPMLASLVMAGLVAAAVGIVVGTPSLRIKGLYLLVATLAAQFVVVWAIQRIPWIGAGSFVTLNTPPVYIGSWRVNSAIEQYYVTLAVAAVVTVLAINLVRSRIGRAWIAIRDQDVAAAVMGISMLRYKLFAFMVSAMYAGVAGGLVVFVWVGAANIQEYGLGLSIQILGMIIIGGLGSILGSYLGAAFVSLLPVLISIAMHELYSLVGGGGIVSAATLANAEHVVFGALIVLFLALEPLGLARLWNRGLAAATSRLAAARAVADEE